MNKAVILTRNMCTKKMVLLKWTTSQFKIYGWSFPPIAVVRHLRWRGNLQWKGCLRWCMWKGVTIFWAIKLLYYILSSRVPNRLDVNIIGTCPEKAGLPIKAPWMVSVWMTSIGVCRHLGHHNLVAVNLVHPLSLHLCTWKVWEEQ